MNEFKSWLLGVIKSLFDEDLNDSEFDSRCAVLAELEHCAVNDGWLTWAEIVEVEEAYAAYAA